VVKKILKGILAILLFLVLCLPAVYTNSVYGYVPPIFIALLLIVSGLLLYYVSRHIQIESDFVNGECERGESVSVGLYIVNHSKIFCPKAVANIFISDSFGGTGALTQTYFTMPPNEKNNFAFDLDMPHIGIYEVGVQDLELYDFFGFFTKRVPIKAEFEVCVKPRIYDMGELNDDEYVLEESSQDTRMTVMNGTDYVGVREYEMGDSMKQIHWKLSAHSLGYMTKVQESSREKNFSVILDFAAEKNPDKEVLLDIQDSLIETALSLLNGIAARHTLYSLLYCNKEEKVVRVTPKGREEDVILMKNFSGITPEPATTYPDASTILQEEGSQANRSTNVMICTSRVTEELVQELLKIKRQRRSPELYQIVPAGFDSKKVRSLLAALQQLDEAGIPHYFIYTTQTGGQAE
jgi:uncharacterized protein (DUF58 family)